MNADRALYLAGRAEYLPAGTSNGRICFRVPDAPTGVYRLTALFDARQFDWDRLWLPMHRFGNVGQKTGPWDFDFEGSVPLVPAWWLQVNGQRLGLAAVRRPTPGDIAKQHMVLNCCFELVSAGAMQVEMSPFNESAVSAMRLTLEPDHDDRPSPLELRHPMQQASLAWHQAHSQIWNQWREKTGALGGSYQVVLDRSIALAKSSADDPELLILLAYAWHSQGDREALDLARAAIGRLVEQPHWGNPLEAGYGHDGDMKVAAMLETLSFVWHWLGEDLGLHQGRPLRELLLEKLRLQMARFRTQLLLWNDYWGGSILQDHGHRSVGRFGVACLNLLGDVPEAKAWGDWVAGRMDRVLSALPPDGAIPFSSYHKLHLYMDDLLTWRDALQHATGRDIYDSPLFGRIVDFVANRLDEANGAVMCVTPRGDRKDFYAGWGFLNAIAARNRDGRAAALVQRLLQHYQSRPMLAGPAATVLAAIHHADPSVAPVPLKPAEWDYRDATGLLSYRPRGGEVAVQLRCAVPAGMPSFYRTNCPCDRIMDAPLEGHFSVHVRGQALLLTAEGGYRMRSALGCVLLVGGKGGWEDQDYAMGVPGVSYRGQQVETAWHEPASGKAYIRMNLAAAYPREAGLVQYVREFYLTRQGLLCRDRVVAQAARQFSWLFHTYARRELDRQAANTWRISDGPAALTLEGKCLEAALASQVGDTEVVWAYGNENDNQPFRHIAFRVSEPLQVMTAEFRIGW